MMKTQIKILLATFAFAGGANAATLSILGGLTAPEGPVLAENFSASALGSESFRSNHAQTFTVAAGSTIDKIAVAFLNFNSSGTTDTFTFNFARATSTAEASTLVLGPSLDSVSFSIADLSPSLSNGDAFTLVFDVANTTASAGDVFAWAFTGPTGSSVTHWANIRQTSTSEANRALIEPGVGYRGTTRINDQRDNLTYVVAIPEPSTALLGGLGLLALLRRRR